MLLVCVCVCVCVCWGGGSAGNRWAWRSRRNRGPSTNFSTGSLVPSPHPGELQALDRAESWVHFHPVSQPCPKPGVHLRSPPWCLVPALWDTLPRDSCLPRTSTCHWDEVTLDQKPEDGAGKLCGHVGKGPWSKANSKCTAVGRAHTWSALGIYGVEWSGERGNLGSGRGGWGDTTQGRTGQVRSLAFTLSEMSKILFSKTHKTCNPKQLRWQGKSKDKLKLKN